MFKIIFISLLIFVIEVDAQMDSVITYFSNGNIESIIHLTDKVRDGELKEALR